MSFPFLSGSADGGGGVMTREEWAVCQDGALMLQLLAKASGPVGSDGRRPLVLAACECARLVLQYVVPGETRPQEAIEKAEGWARGEGVSLDEVRAAAAAAALASDAAARAATDADAAAYAAAADAARAAPATRAAAYAADAAAAAAAAAADAAVPAAHAAAYAAAAADAYADDAAFAVAAADDAAADATADAAHPHREGAKTMQGKCADIVRRYFREPPPE